MTTLKMKPGMMFSWPSDRFKDQTAIIFKDSRLTFSEMDALINRLGNGLLSLGLTTGHKVALLMDNSIESAACIFAVPRAGLTYVGLNTRNSPGEHLRIFMDAEIDALIIDETYLRALEPVLFSVPTLKHIVTVGAPQPGRISLTQVIEGQSASAPDVEVDEDKDIARIQYTSGTTGCPKGAVWTFRIYDNIVTSVLINMDQPICQSDVNLCCGPLTHAAGLFMMVCYSRGAANLILPEFDEEEVFKSIESERVTSILLVPTMLYRILDAQSLDSYNLSSIKQIWYGTAPISVRYLRKGLHRFGSVFRQNYGMTEIPQPITYLDSKDHILKGSKAQMRHLASAGRPAMGVEIKIIDENGKAVATGEMGEVLIRANKLLKEYWKMPDETARALKDGWFHTRDVAKMDDEGYLYIIDRKSDMIISGGFNVYPREVETILLRHPDVSEAAVFSVPHNLWGEAIKAAVVRRQGAALTSADIIQFCKENLASYKKPASVDFVDQLPKNANGKIDRGLLKAPFWQNIKRRVH